MTLVDAITHSAADAGGAVLSAGARTLSVVRPARKPLHPEGWVMAGRLSRDGLLPPLGVPLVDQRGVEPVLVRESRAIGLPAPLPDIHGLAVRVTNPDGSAGDLLLATTGWGRLGRFVLIPSRTTYGRRMTTLLPYRTSAGPFLVGARSVGTGAVTLSYAIGNGRWRDFASLTVYQLDASDADVSFDPVLNPVAGLEQYPAVARLRAPAYRSARRSREQRQG